MANGRGMMATTALNSARKSARKAAMTSTAQYISVTEKNIKEKKMGYFKRKLRDWLYSDEEDQYVSVDKAEENDLRGDNTLTFHVIPASGGRIVQVRKYDSRQDRHITTLHIITPEEDVPTSLAHILALEKLSQ
jgi:hypothetical protein